MAMQQHHRRQTNERQIRSSTDSIPSYAERRHARNIITCTTGCSNTRGRGGWSSRNSVMLPLSLSLPRISYPASITLTSHHHTTPQARTSIDSRMHDKRSHSHNI